MAHLKLLRKYVHLTAILVVCSSIVPDPFELVLESVPRSKFGLARFLLLTSSATDTSDLLPYAVERGWCLDGLIVVDKLAWRQVMKGLEHSKIPVQM